MADHLLPTSVDAAVIGAGVWGLDRRVAAGRRRGDRRRWWTTAGEPTAAVAAGMLCPWSEHEDDGERDFYTALRFAAAAWPTFAAEVEAAAGLPSGFHRCGSVYVAARPEHLGAVRRVRDTLARNGRPEDWQDADALTARRARARPGRQRRHRARRRAPGGPRRARHRAARRRACRRRRVRGRHRRGRAGRCPRRWRDDRRGRRRERCRPRGRAALADECRCGR